MKTALIVTALVFGGCMTADKPKSGSGSATGTGSGSGSVASTGIVPVVTTVKEAVAAKGTQVRVRGVVQREKIGDTLRIEDAMSVLCVGATFPDAVIGTTAEATGTLAVSDAFVGTGGGSGPARQGKAPGSKQWVLERCTIP